MTLSSGVLSYRTLSHVLKDTFFVFTLEYVQYIPFTLRAIRRLGMTLSSWLSHSFNMVRWIVIPWRTKISSPQDFHYLIPYYINYLTPAPPPHPTPRARTRRERRTQLDKNQHLTYLWYTPFYSFSYFLLEKDKVSTFCIIQCIRPLSILTLALHHHQLRHMTPHHYVHQNPKPY